MAGNTYMGYVFMAIWKAADGEIKVEDFKKVTQEMMDRPLVKIIKGGNDMNRKEDVEKMSNMLHAADAWQKAHPEYAEKSWDFHFDETKHKDGFYYYFTRCPMETYAREHGFDFFTTTLSISPLKNAEKLNEIGKDLESQYGVRYLFSDFKKKEGYKKSTEISKQYDMYRQYYCGCVFSKEQRDREIAARG